ncbi:hypothetical protein ACTMU2_20375 [Cupriavidus basilensis]
MFLYVIVRKLQQSIAVKAGFAFYLTMPMEVFGALWKPCLSPFLVEGALSQRLIVWLAEAAATNAATDKRWPPR